MALSATVAKRSLSCGRIRTEARTGTISARTTPGIARSFCKLNRKGKLPPRVRICGLRWLVSKLLPTARGASCAAVSTELSTSHRRIARAAQKLFLPAILAGLASCSTSSFTPVLGEFPLNRSHENVPLRFELSPDMLRRPIVLDVRGPKDLEALKAANAQVVLRIRNDGQHPVRIGMPGSGDGGGNTVSSVELQPGWMATAFTGSAAELIMAGRQSGLVSATGDDAHISVTAIFSNIASLKRDMPFVVRMAAKGGSGSRE